MVKDYFPPYLRAPRRAGIIIPAAATENERASLRIFGTSELMRDNGILPERTVLACKICVWSLRGQGLMRWVRANRRAVACCALFALAVQLILSFGHFHLTVGLGSGSSSLASSFGDQARPQPGDTDGGPSKPAVPVADYCGICAVINLAGSVVPPAAPAVLQPVAVISTVAWRIVETSATPSPHIDARARAPPAV